VFRGVFVFQEMEDAGNREEYFRKEVQRVPSPAPSRIICSPSVRRSTVSDVDIQLFTDDIPVFGRL
jgi:hypothetical protein